MKNPVNSRRKSLTPRQRQAILLRQDFKCPGLPHLKIKCGKAITDKTAVFDHIEQRYFTGSDNVFEFQALCCAGRTSCNSIKTYGLPGAGSAGSDAHKRAKVRRLQRGKKPSKHKLPPRINPWPKGRKLQSRNNLRRS